MSVTVEQFRGDYYFLSNMYPLEFKIETRLGIWVPTSEHAYQAAKFVNPETHIRVAGLATGQETKVRAHELEEAGEMIQPRWDDIKIGVMEEIVREKFRRNPELAEKLAATAPMPLYEGNTWCDDFWGVYPPESRNGSNHLGRILMTVRDEL